MDPYAYLPHKMAINALLYVSNGSGLQSEVVTCLSYEVVVHCLCSKDLELGFWLTFQNMCKPLSG